MRLEIAKNILTRCSDGKIMSQLSEPGVANLLIICGFAHVFPVCNVNVAGEDDANNEDAAGNPYKDLRYASHGASSYNAAITASANAFVPAVPPTSPVSVLPSAYTFSSAACTFSAAAASSMYASINTAD